MTKARAPKAAKFPTKFSSPMASLTKKVHAAEKRLVVDKVGNGRYVLPADKFK